MRPASTRRRRLLGLGALALCAALLLPASQASARKVGNPGGFVATVTDGTLKVGSQTFNFDDSNPSQTITFTGTVAADGTVNIPASGANFPPIPFSASGYDLTVYIFAAQPIVGSLNPVTGVASLDLRVWIRINGIPGDTGTTCHIASASSPIVVNPLTTGTSGTVSGTPYNPSNGSGEVANGTYGVPGAQDCDAGGIINLNGTVNDAVGIPSAAGNNTAEFTLGFNPIITKGVNASFTAAPNSGTVPFNVNFNAGASTCTAPCSYQWDFDGNGTTDQTTSVPTTSFNYTSPAIYQAKLTTVDTDGDSDSTTRTVTANPPPPDLTIDKSHTGVFYAGNDGDYTIEVDNNGAGATVGTTTVTDTLPAGLSYVSGTGTGWDCSGSSGQNVSCAHAGAIPPSGSAAPLTLTTAVAGSAPSSLTNTASVATPTEVNTADNSDDDATTVERIDLAIDKSHAANFVTGATETWELEVSNGGDAATTGTTTVSDSLPGGIAYVGFDAPGDWSCSAAGQLVTCTNPNPIAPAQSDVIELNVIASVVAVPSVTNTATVSTPNDADPANDSDSDPTTVEVSVDLGIDKSHAGAFRVGSDGTYTLAVRNFGARPTSGTTTVTDTLPAGLTYVSATGTGWSCGAAGQDVTCTNPASLGAGQSADPITLTVAVDQAALPSATNTAAVATSGTGNDADLNPANDSDSDPTAVTATDLTIDKSHSGSLPVGAQGTFTLTVRNDGNAPSAGTVTVSDTLPAELSYVGATGTGWSCGAAGQDVTCTRSAAINPGQNAPTISLDVAVDSGTTLEETVNTATVAGNGDVNPANDSDTDTAPLIAADLAITKTHTGDFRVGDTRAYFLGISNVGSQPTTGTTTVTDTLPAGLTYVDATGSGWSCGAAGQDVTCTRSAAIPAASGAPTISLQVAVDTAAHPAVTNQAEVDNSGDRNAANDTASDPTTITAPDLAVTKTHAGSLQVGDRASYLIAVSNDGSAGTTSTATVTDTLPAGLTYAGAVGDDWSCSAAGQLVSCDHDGAIAAGSAAETLELRADVDASAAAQVSNTAAVALGDDPNPANDSDDDLADVGRIDLAIDKSHAGDLPRGGSGQFTIDVSNEGSDPTEGTTRVSDALPAGLSYDSATGSGWSCSVSAGTVSCDRAGSIAAGAAAPPITLSVDVSPLAPATITNTASVTTPDEADPSDDSDSDQADVVAMRDAAISLKPRLRPGGSFRVGTTGTYAASVRNAGGAALSGPITTIFNLPFGTSFVSGKGAGWSCSATGRSVRCTRAAGLAVGARSDLAIEVAVGKQAVPSGVATARVFAPGDSVAANDRASAPVAVKMIDLAVSLTHSGSFAVGAQSSFTVSVENVGSAATIGPTTVTDTLPAGLTVGAPSGSGWTCSLAGQALRCVRSAALRPGQQAAPLVIPVTPAAGIGGLVIANAAFAATPGDGEGANNSASDAAAIGPAPQTAAPPVTQKAKTKKKKCKKKKGKKGKRKKCGKKKKKKK